MTETFHPLRRSSGADSDDLNQMTRLERKRMASLAALPELEPPLPDEAGGGEDRRLAWRRAESLASRLALRARGWFRAGRVYVLLAAGALFCLRFPMAVPAVLVLTFWLTLLLLVAAGPARLGRWLAALWRGYAARFPRGAEMLRRRADAMALRVDSVLDRLPFRWAENVSLPDFSQPAGPDRPERRPAREIGNIRLPQVYRG